MNNTGGFHFIGGFGMFPFMFFNLSGENLAYGLAAIENFFRPYLENIPRPQLNLPPDRRSE